MEDIIDIIVTETTNLIEITSQPTDEVIDVNIIDNREDITLNVTPSVVEININSLTGNFGVEWGDITGTLSNQTDLNTALSLKADLVDGKVPSSQLPSYVDDVVEVANYASLPATGEVGKIYITLDTNFIYRWTGSTYVEIKDSSAVWGAITGTLSNQTDLQSALDAKQNQLNGTGFVKASGTTISYDNSTYLKGSLSDGFIPYWSSSLGALTNSFIEKFGNFTQIGGSGLDVFNGMTVSGRYDNIANAPKIFSSDESTGMAHISFINSGGGFNLGVNKSTANGLMSGASAYATVLTSLQATNLEFGTDATKRLTINGTTGNATFESSVGIGTSSLTGYNLRVSKNITGATTSYGVMSDGVIQSDVTTAVIGYGTILTTQSASFTLGSLYHFRAQQTTLGAGSTVNLQVGFDVANTLTGATQNIAFRSLLNAGTNVWNLYMNGTASNYLAGSLGIGNTSVAVFNLRVDKNVTGGTTAYGGYFGGNVQSDVTSQMFGVMSSYGTQATTFTLSNLYNFHVVQGTFGAGSTVTNQHGFSVASSLIGATNNYGFRGQIASGTGRWNLYMDGTANNHLAGNLLIGSTADNGSKLQVTGAATFSSSVTATQLAIGTTTLNRVLNVSGAGTDGTQLQISGTTDSAGIKLIPSTGDNWEIQANTSNQFFVYNRTDSAYRFLIDGAGNVGIGTTSPGGKLEVNDTVDSNTITSRNTGSGFAATLGFFAADRNTTNNTFFFLRCYNYGSSTYRFNVADSGNVTNANNSYGAISDIKLKENISDATSKLSDLLKIKVKNYNFIGSDEKQLGVIAQEVEEVFPGLVEINKDKDGYGNDLGTVTKSVKYSVFVPMLIKAVQELKAELDTLKNK